MSKRRITDKKRSSVFRKTLLDWYAEHGRDLPWRKTENPYHILVSEIMLQQTQVDRVIPKYHEFLEKYPDVETLAEAPTDEVKEAWRPLGYNIRPVRLQMIAYNQALMDFGATVCTARKPLCLLCPMQKFCLAYPVYSY